MDNVDDQLNVVDRK